MQLAFLVTALAGSAVASHVLHEVREVRSHSPWIRTQRVDPDAIIPVRIGLKQNNLEAGEERLLQISHPDSEHYGKHLSMEEVHDFFAPSQHSVDAVRSWLLDFGIGAAIITHSDNKGWLALNIPVSTAEELFQSELHEYEHTHSGHLRIGTDRYHLPKHLVEHIDYVTPGVKMSAKLRKKSIKQLENRSSQANGVYRGATKWVDNGNNPPWYGYQPPSYQLPKDLQHCAVNMTPPCWRALYGIPVNHIKDDVNDCGLYEQGDYFIASDLTKWLKTFSPRVPSNTQPQVLGIDGGQAPVGPDNPNVGGEADLDIDIVTSLIYPQAVIVYQVDDAIYAPAEVALDNTFNTFLDALDGSYCTYSAYGITGNSPKIDPVYPNPAAGGYKGQLQCGVYKPTRVISASFGEAEQDFPKNYVQRQCNEFMKLGLQGHTIFFASGDFAVGGFPGDPTASGCLSGSGQNQTIYNPQYPSDCPWVTSVGATQLYANQTVRDGESVMQVDLSGPGRPDAYKFFATAGGFSNFFKRPAYQKKAVSSYFANHDPGYKHYNANAKVTNVGANGGIYNRIGRGYPDVSANGAYMPVFVNGTLGTYFGSSLAAPIWASVVTLLNQRRTQKGKGPIGFINPTLYEHPELLNDIVNGSNPNCGSAGFPAVSGWDPSSGLGTPNFPKLLDYFLSLP